MNWKFGARSARRTVAVAAVTALGAGTLSLAVASPSQALSFVSGAVVDAAGRPLAGVPVRLYEPVIPQGTFRMVEAGSGNTDRDGGFKIPTTSPSVKVLIDTPGDGPGYELVGEWYNDKVSFETADAVPPGDLGAISLSSGGSISGVVTSDAGVPLEGITVRASGIDDSDFASGSATTDVTGAYTISGLPTNNYQIEFSDADLDRSTSGSQAEYLAERYNDVKFDPNAFPPPAATPVALAPGAAVGGINAALTPSGYVAQGVDLTGRVVDSTGRVMVGAEVTAYAVGPNRRDGVLLGSAVTNRQGVYNFTGLDASGQTQVRLQADSPNLGRTDFARLATWSGNQFSYAAAAAVPLVPGGVANGGDIMLPVTGGISGSVAGAAGPSNTGDVSLYDAEGNYVAGASSRVDGTFESRSVPAGTYYAKFDGEELVPEWWNDAAVRAKSKPIVVKAGAMVSGLNASLAGALAVIEKPVVSGVPIVGKELSVSSGLWNQQDGSIFSYEWMAGGTVVATGNTFTPTSALVGKALQVRVSNQPAARVSAPSSVTVTTYKVGFPTKLKVKAKKGKAAITVTNQKVKAKKIKGTVTAQLLDSEGNLTKSFGKAKIKKGKGSMSLTKLLKKAKGDRKKVVFTFVAKTNKVGAAVLNAKVKKLKKK